MEDKDFVALAEKLERASDDIHELKGIVADATKQMTVINTYILGENGVMKRLDGFATQLNSISTAIVKLETKDAMRSTWWGLAGGSIGAIIVEIVKAFT
jgi:hypothetical protein